MAKGKTETTEKKARPLFILAKAVDGEGNVIPDATIVIDTITRNTRHALKAQAADRDLKAYEKVAV